MFKIPEKINIIVKKTICILILFLLGSALYCTPKMPHPTGTYDVGTTIFQLTDKSRPEIFTDDPGDYRKLLIQVWYPAKLTGNEKKAPYWSNPKETRKTLAKALGVPPVLFLGVSGIQTHSYLNAAVSDAESRYPVLIFSHGYYPGLETQNMTLMQDLASHGYIVFSIAHTYETAMTIFPDGTKASYADMSTQLQAQHKEQNETFAKEFLAGDEIPIDTSLLGKLEKYTFSTRSIQIWSTDITFLIDELEKMNMGQNQKTETVFMGKLDVTKLGVFGQSFGGAASAQVSVDDPRCKAAINMDGFQWGALSGKPLIKPFMVMYSEENSKVLLALHDVIYNNSKADFYTVRIKGSFHNDYSDFTLLTLFKHFQVLGPIPGKRMLDITNTYVRAFFDKHLKGHPTVLFDGSSSLYPEVILEQAEGRPGK